MNTLLTAQCKTTTVPSPCFHCGEAVSPYAHFAFKFENKIQPLCCAGCKAVAQTILDAGLGAYYNNRTATAAMPPERDAVGALFDIDSVASTYVVTPNATQRELDIYIEGITCAACVWLAESALARVPGVSSVLVNQITHRAKVNWSSDAVTIDTLIASLACVGLGAQPASSSERFAARQRAQRRALIALGVAALSMMQVMMFTVPIYLADAGDVAAEVMLLLGWAGFVLTVPVVLYSARTFYSGAWRDLRQARIGMDLPIVLAIIATFFSSTFAMLNGGKELYFDSISMFVFLLLAARYLESRVRESSLAVVEKLTNAQPTLAWHASNYPADSDCTQVAAATLNIGDVIRVSTGEAVAADGLIVAGESAFDESLLSGEARPQRRGAASRLVAGSLNVGSPVFLKVTAIGTITTAAKLGRLTEHALASRSHFVALTNRVARWVAPITIALALGGAIAWWFIDPTRSFSVAVAVLAIACPCALALAAPAAQAIAINRLAREGLLITRAETLEKIAAATNIAFDKTGTLTNCESAITATHLLGKYSETEILAMCVALEAGSAHPIARGLNACAAQVGMRKVVSPVVKNLNFSSGNGVSGEVDGIALRLGRQAFVQALVGCDLPHAISNATLFIGCEGSWLGAFELNDAVKPDAHTMLQALARTGLTPHLLSGDCVERVNSVAQSLNIDSTHAHGEQSPQDKLDYIRARPSAWIAVGDGVNDAPLLGAADVSIAMGAGADITRITADAVLLSPHLMPLVTARQVAIKLKRIIAQNFCWALAYNLVALPLALGGFISPASAALGMALSSMVVIINSMRLGKR